MIESMVDDELSENSSKLREAWEQLKSDEPGIRPRQAARKIGVTELELLSALCDGDQVVRLDVDPEELIHRAEEFGYAMALTRNDAVISQTEGYYTDIEFEQHAGNVLGDNIDLRLFPNSWVEFFAVSGEFSKSGHPSVQIFHESGASSHKIYLLEDEKQSEFEAIIDDYRHSEQTVEPEMSDSSENDSDDGITEIDEEAFLEDWRVLEDTHGFFGLLRDYNIDRTRAFNIARDEFTEPVPVNGILEMLELASRNEIPIMAFVRSPGCIQIYSGTVENVSGNDQWYNVLDDDFDLHVNHPKLTEAWVVEKPVETGHVTSIEAFDEDGFQSVSFFGVRKSGEEEDQDWRELTDTIREMDSTDE